MEVLKRLQMEAKGAAFRRLKETAQLSDPLQDPERHLQKFPVTFDRSKNSLWLLEVHKGGPG